MSTKAKSICNKGENCPYLKLGTCKFDHKSNPKAQPNMDKKTVAKRSVAVKPAVNIAHVVRIHAARATAIKARIAALQADTKVVSSYFDVKSGKPMSWANADEIESLSAQLGMLKDVARSAIGRSKIRTCLYSGGTGNGAANTAIAASIPIVPANAAEWSSYATLYDEVKVTRVVVHYCTGFTAAASASIPAGGVVFCAVGYDSTYNSTPSSIPEVMESSQHQLTASQPALTGAVISHSLHKFDIQIPAGPVANSTAVTGGTGIIANFPGEWMAMGDLADGVGYFRIYVEAGGVSAVMGYRLLTEYHCEFRERT